MIIFRTSVNSISLLMGLSFSVAISVSACSGSSQDLAPEEPTQEMGQGGDTGGAAAVSEESSEPVFGEKIGDCEWREGQAAVSLTYDDAMPTQKATAVPALKAHGLKATFFVGDVSVSLDIWSALVDEGHEMGAHTFNHPCPAANSWVAEGKGNEDYDLNRMALELDENIEVLKALGQPAPYTFAYPCGETYVDDPNVSYIPLIEERFIAARGATPGFIGRSPEYFNIPSSFIKSSASQLISLVNKAQESGSWVVLGFHGIGGDWETLDADAHEEFLQYLEDKQKELFVAPFGTVVQCLQAEAKK